MTKNTWRTLALAIAGLGVAEAALRHRHRRSARREPDPGLRPERGDDRSHNWPFRVVALGDSNTYGLDLPEEAAFPALLEARLRARGIRARVWNAGINGHTVLQGLSRLERDVVQRQPDVVLLAFGLNDCNLSRWHTDDQREARLFPPGIHRWLRQSHIYQTITARLERWLGRTQQAENVSETPRPQPRVHPFRFREALVRMVRTIRRSTGARVYLLTTNPVRALAASSQTSCQLCVHGRYNALVRLAAWESSASLVDLERELARHPEMTCYLEADGVHLTAEGHRLVADIIWRAWEEDHLTGG